MRDETMIDRVAMQLVENAFGCEQLRRACEFAEGVEFKLLTDELGPALTLLGVSEGDAYDREPYYKAMRDPKHGPLSFLDFVRDRLATEAEELGRDS